ncbi:unnamed protein product [Orchesella dallaii]|uniref:Uncharacterized protein n=1 Tax=Orchesella dallaii TaxID=48710 RepID=A0ABP1RP70_9HEXA
MAPQQLVQNHINLSQVHPPSFPTIEILLVANKNLREENHQLKSRLHHNQPQLRHQTLTNHTLNRDLWKANHTHSKSIQDRNAIALNEPMDLNMKSRNATTVTQAESFSDQDRIQSVSYPRKGDINVTDKNVPSDIQSFPFYTSVLEFKNNLIVPPHPSFIQNNNEQEGDCLNPGNCLNHSSFEKVQGSSSINSCIANEPQLSPSGMGMYVNHTNILQDRNPQRGYKYVSLCS